MSVTCGTHTSLKKYPYTKTKFTFSNHMKDRKVEGVCV